MPKLRELMPTLEFFADIHKKNSQPTDEYHTICQHYCRLSSTSTRVGHMIYVGLYAFFFLAGAFELLRTNGKSQIVHVYLPGIYANSFNLIVFLTCLNTAIVWHAAALIPPPDMLFLFTFSNVPIIPAITRQIVAELNALLRMQHSERTDYALTAVKDKFLHIIDIHKKYNE